MITNFPIYAYLFWVNIFALYCIGQEISNWRNLLDETVAQSLGQNVLNSWDELFSEVDSFDDLLDMALDAFEDSAELEEVLEGLGRLMEVYGDEVALPGDLEILSSVEGDRSSGGGSSVRVLPAEEHFLKELVQDDAEEQTREPSPTPASGVEAWLWQLVDTMGSQIASMGEELQSTISDYASSLTSSEPTSAPTPTGDEGIQLEIAMVIPEDTPEGIFDGEYNDDLLAQLFMSLYGEMFEDEDYSVPEVCPVPVIPNPFLEQKSLSESEPTDMCEDMQEVFVTDSFELDNLLAQLERNLNRISFSRLDPQGFSIPTNPFLFDSKSQCSWNANSILPELILRPIEGKQVVLSKKKKVLGRELPYRSPRTNYTLWNAPSVREYLWDASDTWWQNVCGSETESTEDLFSWLRLNGARIGNISVGEFNGMRGLRADQEFKKGDILFNISTKLMIWQDSIIKDEKFVWMSSFLHESGEEMNQESKKEYANQVLILYLMYQAWIIESSRFQPWLCSLPKRICLPWVEGWGCDFSEWPKNFDVKARSQVRRRKKIVRRVYLDAVVPFRLKNNLPAWHFSERLTEYFAAAVYSRAWTVDSEYLENRTSMIIPLADLANHHKDATMLSTQHTATFGGRFLKAFKDFKVGDEIFDNYGRKSEINWMLGYGFLPNAENQQEDQCSLKEDET